MSVVRAAAVQLSPVLYSREGTIEKVVRKLELGRRGVLFVTFPETVVPYYFSTSATRRVASIPGAVRSVGLRINTYSSTLQRSICWRRTQKKGAGYDGLQSCSHTRGHCRISS